jgi:imidazolonepropionase
VLLPTTQHIEKLKVPPVR